MLPTLEFLNSSGQSAEIIKCYDWKSTSLGEPHFWPQSLKTAIGIVLGSKQACNLLWGPDMITFYNDAYRPLLGSKIPEGIGLSYPIFRPDAWPFVERQIMAGFAGQATIEENFKVLTRRHGKPETAYFTVSFSLVYDEQNAVGGVISHILETTSAVNARQELADEVSLLRRGLNQLPQMVWSARPDGHHDFYNDRWYEFTGVPRGSTDGEGWQRVLHPDDLERVWALWRHALKAGNPTEIQYRLKRHDGSYQWSLGRALAERDETGKIIRWYGTCTDIHDQVLAEEKLRTLQAELIHLSRVSAMGAMASTLAHELNQPLMAIANYAAGSKRLVEQGAKPTELSEPLDAIERNAHRSGEVIRRLREMTRKGEIRKERFFLHTIINEAAALVSVGACRDVELQYDLRDGGLIMGDPIQIQQVLINVIRNACDAIADRTNRKVLIVSQIAGDHMHVSVEDSGPGISPDKQPTLFEPFFSTKEDGMGVGLSISRTIIEAHGGKIWAENRPEGGARFSFTLPLAGSS